MPEQVPVPEQAPEGEDPRLAALVAAATRDPSHTVVGLDFDGTLAPLVPDPQDSRPLPGTLDVLARLGDAGVTVVVVTGRAPEVAAHLAGLTGHPLAPGLQSLVVHGHYGLQTWSAADGSLTSTVTDGEREAVARVRDELPGLLASRRSGPGEVGAGATVEDKEVSLVVHTRRAADPQGALEALVPALTALARRLGLEVQPGRFVCELRPGGVDKGGTLTAVLDRVGATAALYAGDDVGDLPAWDALSRARDRGVTTLGLASGQEGTDARVEAAADLVVDGPAGVLAVLRALADALDDAPAQSGDTP